MKKENVLYFTILPSPFQLEFIKYLNKNSTQYKFIPIFMTKIPNYRKTWGEEVEDDFLIIDENSFIKKLRKIITLLQKYKPKKIILTQYNQLYTHIVILYSLFNKVKYYIGPIENMHKRNLIIDLLKKSFFSIVAFKASALFAIGNNAVNDYSNLYNGKVLNIPYTFNLKHLYQSKKNIPNSSVKTTFLYSGRLIPFRNPLLVIECFAEISKEYKNVRLIMSGRGELKESCDKLIEQLNIKDIVRWENDFKNWYDIHKNLYRQGDVLLALQHYSTWGLIIQEAMATGLGIIATRTMESTNELIVDNYNGYLVDLNKDEIVHKMKKYLNDKTLVALHAKRSQDIVQVIDLENVGNNFLDFFEND